MKKEGIDIMKDYIVDGKVVRIELEDGRKVTAATEFLEKMMANLEIDMDEAVMTWLEDEEYLINDDQEDLCIAAKENKVLANVRKGDRDAAKEKKKTTRTVKVNPFKEEIVAKIAEMLDQLNGVENVVIENKGKIVTFDCNGESYKVDLIQKRKSKENK